LYIDGHSHEFFKLHGAWERFLAIHDGLAEVARPRDELLEEGRDLLHEIKDRFKGLLSLLMGRQAKRMA